MSNLNTISYITISSGLRSGMGNFLFFFFKWAALDMAHNQAGSITKRERKKEIFCDWVWGMLKITDLGWLIFFLFWNTHNTIGINKQGKSVKHVMVIPFRRRSHQTFLSEQERVSE